MSSRSTSLAPLAQNLAHHFPTTHLSAESIRARCGGVSFLITPSLDVDPLTTSILTLHVDALDAQGEASISVWGAEASCVWLTGTEPNIDWDAAASTIASGVSQYVETMTKAGAL